MITRLMRGFSIILLSLTMVGLATAANVHFKKAPVFSDVGLSLAMTGSLAGLGNGDIIVTLTAVGIPEVECTSPGGNPAPGQNPGETTVSGAVAIPADAIKNGNVTVTVMTQPPPAPDPAVACPNANWSAENITMEFSSATITVIQGGVTVLQQSFSL